MTEVNRHHVMFERGLYKRRRVHFQLRSHPGLILPLRITDHRELHATIERRHGATVPLPDLESTEYFLSDVASYRRGQPWHRTLDQAIGWFAMTDNEPTAEVLDWQRDFIRNTEPLMRLVQGGAEYGESQMDRGRAVVSPE